MTDDQQAQACAAAFKPLAEMGKTLNNAAGFVAYRLPDAKGSKRWGVNSPRGPIEETWGGEGAEGRARSKADALNKLVAMVIPTLAEQPGEAKWLVYSRVHNGWLSAKMDGYRVNIANAGRFTLEQATRIVGGIADPTSGDEAGFVVPDPDAATLSAQVAAMREVLEAAKQFVYRSSRFEPDNNFQRDLKNAVDAALGVKQ